MRDMVRAAVKPVAAAVDRVRQPPGGVTVLIYHRVGAGTDSQVDLDLGVFIDQMAELADSGRLMSLDDAVDLLVSDEQADPDPVVITFDDGTPDVIDQALPVLQQYRVPMTLYLATGFVGGDVGFWSPDEPALTWDALRDAVSTGLVDIGSHTHSHKLLDRTEPESVVDELERSIDLIGSQLGVEARHFAYPKAIPPSKPVDEAVRARFVSAALAGTKPNPWGQTDVHALARSPIQRSDGMRWFRHKAVGGLGLEDRIRDLVNKRAYADATR